MDTDALQILDHAMKPIVDEMFQNGFEAGCRIWEDGSHPLHQAVAILLRASVWVRFPGEEAAHRCMEENI